jgi:hypothetical protein
MGISTDNALLSINLFGDQSRIDHDERRIAEALRSAVTMDHQISPNYSSGLQNMRICAEIDQMVPIAVVPGQTRCFKCQHRSNSSVANRSQ